MAKSRSSPGWRGITAAIAASLLPALLVTSVADTGQVLAAGPASLRVTGTVHTHIPPTPTAQYSAVTFLNALQGWIAGSVGNEGVIWATSDAGARWSRAAIGPVQPLALDFVSANDGFALGQPTGVHCPANGCPNVLFHTADGGRTWRAALSEAAAAGARLFLTAVAFTGPATGYALGYQDSCRGGLTCNTAVYRTRDGGRTWQPLRLGGFVPTSVQFLSARDGYLGGFTCPRTGCRAVILSTTDAGARWTTSDLPLPVYPVSVATIDVDFVDASHGWVLATPPGGVSMGGGFGPLLRTGDGGRTWVQQHASFSWGKSDPSVWAGFPSDLHFVSPRVGWLAVDAGAGSGVGGVDLTTDGGRDWARIGSRALWSIAQVAPAGPNQAWAVGGPKLGGPSFVVHLRSDGRAEQVLPAPSPDTAVALVGPEEAVGLGLPSAPGAVLVRQGAHAPWRQAAKLTRALLPQALSARVLPSGGLAAWVAAEVYGSTAWAIWQSSSGGRSWRELDVAHHAWMGIRFFNNARVGVDVESASFAGKDSATLATTLDGGRTWRRGPSVPVGSELMAASFASPTVGYVVTLEASPSFTVWRTTDGGRRWRALGTLPFGGGGPVLLDTTGAGTTWLLVNSDLYRSTDAGATWTRIPLGSTPVVAMSFLGRERGMLVLAGGGLLETFDGGRVWSQEP